jgi:hypothetical protein
MMPAVLRPFLARLLSPFIVAFFMWLGARVGHQYDAEFLDQATLVLVDGLVWSIALFAALTGVTHKAIDRKLNPTDSASPALAEMGAKP